MNGWPGFKIMSSFNKFIGLGNITADPALKRLPNVTICTFTMAMNRKRGEEDEVCFLDVTTFAKLADIVAQYCRKGSQVLVEGRLKQEKWEDKTTKALRSKIIVIADTVTFVGGKKESAGDTPLKEEATDTSDVPF